MLRGEELQRHILFIAKDVFLELGFERTSMDAIAARAGTTKRTLYAHFANKEQLFLAIIDLVERLLGEKLRNPEDYADDPVESLVLFCGRFQRILVWGPAVRLCRRFTAEAENFPEGAARAYDALFGTVESRVAEFLSTRLGQSRDRAVQITEQLMSRLFHPRILRALFGIDPIVDDWEDEAAVDPAFDPAPIRRFIAQAVAHPTGD